MTVEITDQYKVEAEGVEPQLFSSPTESADAFDVLWKRGAKKPRRFKLYGTKWVCLDYTPR